MIVSLIVSVHAMWEQGAAIPTPRRGSMGGRLVDGDGSEILWVTGGSNSNFEDSLMGGIHEGYSVDTDTWRTGASLNVPRSDHASAVIGNSVIVAGGMVDCATGVCNTTSMETYDPVKDQWHTGPDLLRARRGLVMVAVRDILIAFGGMACGDDCYTVTPGLEYLKSGERLDGVEWHPIADAHVGRRDAGAATFEGKMVVVGGCTGDEDTPYDECEPLSSVEIYDLETDTWTYGPELAGPRHGAALAFFDSWIVVLGGSSGKGIDATSSATSLVKEVEALTSLNGSWAVVDTMPDPRDGLTKGAGLVVRTADNVLKIMAVSGSDVTAQYVNTTELLTLSLVVKQHV